VVPATHNTTRAIVLRMSSGFPTMQCQVGFCSTHQDSAYCHVRSYTAIDQTRCDCTLWETGSRSCEALRGPFLAAVTVLESGLSNQNTASEWPTEYALTSGPKP